jgi:RNA polymerase primary sigma factor
MISKVNQTNARYGANSKGRVFDGTLVGAYFVDLDRHKPLTTSEEQELFRSYRAGNQAAKKRIINSNLRFVIKVARTYSGQGVPLADLISEGNFGLMSAVEKFDPDKNFKFISYAVWWIRQSILKAISDQSRIVAIPVNQTQRIGRIIKSVEKLTHKSMSDPTVEEISEDIGVSVDSVTSIIRVMPRALSLDLKSGEEEDYTLLQNLVGDYEDPLEVLSASSSSEELQEALKKLSEVERTVILYTFGFKDDCEYTYNEVGARLGVSRERVRQLRERACNKLRDILVTREAA